MPIFGTGSKGPHKLVVDGGPSGRPALACVAFGAGLCVVEDKQGRSWYRKRTSDAGLRTQIATDRKKSPYVGRKGKLLSRRVDVEKRGSAGLGRQREATCSGRGVFRSYILLGGNEHVSWGRVDNRQMQYYGTRFLLSGTGHGVL